MAVVIEDSAMEKIDQVTIDGYTYEWWFCHKCNCNVRFKWRDPVLYKHDVIHKVERHFGHRLKRKAKVMLRVKG